MRFLRRSLIGLFLLALTVGLLAMAASAFYSGLQDKWAQESKPKPKRERKFTVKVQTAQATNVVPVLMAFGEIRSQRTLDIRAATAGTIVMLIKDFVEGGTVNSGDLLVEIDPRNAQSALERANGDMTEASDELSQATRALTLAKDEVLAAKAQADLRTQSLMRGKDLKRRGVGTDTAVEAAALAESAANQAVLARRQALQAADARLTRAKTRLTRQEVNLADAKRNLDDTKIYAGFGGTLSNVMAVQGGLAAKNERLAQLIDAKQLEVSFRLSTNQYAHLLGRDGVLGNADVQISMDIFGVDMQAKGKISRESAAVGEGLTGRLLFAALETPKGFKPGDFVTVRINEPELENVVTLPASALDAAGTVLLIGADNRLEQQQVKLLREQGNDVIVSASGISGREVVLSRSPLLGPGIKVTAIRQGQAPKAEPEMLQLSQSRRAKLVAFIQDSKKMPEDVKARILAKLADDLVPANMVKRIEDQIGG